jgi:proliferating cell nuclear antigen
MKVLELKTCQSDVIKILFDILKDILIDVNIEFSKDKIKIDRMDNNRFILVNIVLETKNFEYYKCDYTEENPLVLGMNIFNLCKLLKFFNSEDIMIMSVDSENTGVLEIKSINNQKNTITKYLMDLTEINEENNKIPSTDFDTIITYNTKNFHSLLKSMGSLSDKIDIKSYNKQLILSCKGFFCSQETIIGENEDGMIVLKDSDKIIQCKYLSKHLTSFSKCMNLSNFCTIYLKSDFPLMIEYTLGNLGNIKIIIAPAFEEN